MTTAYLLVIAAYLLGAFPTSYLVGRWRKTDLLEQGSGNLGGTNVYRVLGLRFALVVLLVDLLKGFAPVWFFPALDGRAGPWELAYGTAAIAGHVWPVYTRFRGGKGVATAAGTLLAVAPVAVVIAILVWVGTLLLTRIASLASLLSATLVPLLARGAAAPLHVVLYSLLLASVVWWTHRENITRMLRGEELRVELGRGRKRPPGEGS